LNCFRKLSVHFVYHIRRISRNSNPNSPEFWGAWQFLDIFHDEVSPATPFELWLLAQYHIKGPSKHIYCPSICSASSFQSRTVSPPFSPRFHLGEVLTYFCIYVTWNYTMRDKLLCGWKSVCLNASVVLCVNITSANANAAMKMQTSTSKQEQHCKQKPKQYTKKSFYGLSTIKKIFNTLFVLHFFF